MKINFVEKLLGSGFYSGYIKTASGTWGSFAGLIIYLIPGFENPSLMILMISLFILIGVPIATKFESIYGNDPKECTIDEIVGMWITLLFLPKKIWWIILAFIIWRVLDIVKPFPARRFDRLHGGAGIMLDDVVSALYVNLVLQGAVALHLL